MRPQTLCLSLGGGAGASQPGQWQGTGVPLWRGSSADPVPRRWPPWLQLAMLENAFVRRDLEIQRTKDVQATVVRARQVHRVAPGT